MTSRPTWMRLDVNIFDNPKMQTLMDRNQHRAIVLWIDCLAYAHQHLTDGWIPEGIPRRRGHKDRDMRALIDVGLIHRMELEGVSGWLIHDYLNYQPSKDWWEGQLEQRRKAARARWDNP